MATGIASRLYRGGHQILMTEIPVPLTVRTQAALSRAVYEGEAQVEDMKGVLVSSMAAASAVLEEGNIPVIVDEHAEIISEYRPDVLIDAILAKKNLGTAITDAPFVIGVGPGFTAGIHCHCVIETKRGHTLGDTIYEGSAIPNTGVPGNVGGYTTERLIRATAGGKIEPLVRIGDFVEKGQIVARTGGKEVYAQMDGIVRGMLQEQAEVWENLKIGDIDARCEAAHCFTISDKARAIGGGALEAVTRFQNMRGKYALIVLAAGKSVRFGGNKLLAFVSDRTLYQHTLERMKAFQDYPRFLVTAYDEIAEYARKDGIEVVMNSKPEAGISHSVRLGLAACLERYPDIQGILFSVCDQPNLKASTVQRILNTASLHKGQIVCAGHFGRTGNPVLWDRKYFGELAGLTGDNGGRQIMSGYRDKVQLVEAEPEELKDIDLRDDILS